MITTRMGLSPKHNITSGSRSAYLGKAGLVLILGSFLVRGGAALYMMHSYKSGSAVAVGAAFYLFGKGLFYLGLFLAGPAILHRYAWLRPAWWVKKLRNREPAQMAQRA